ncbi:MAG: Pr6Pr family membrane protein [Pseudomonadota bacterium]|nr:Pr6Pr family membrane protein [Pseudomonadota bacterium]
MNFFSYFTNFSNLFAAAVLSVGVFQLVAQRVPSVSYDLIRTVAALNMAVDVDLGSLLPWVNTVLHYIMPVAVVLEWLLYPPNARLGTRQLLLCQGFPLLYLSYLLIRGANVGWYPYPFLDPATVGGYGNVALYVIGIVLCFSSSAGRCLCWETSSGTKNNARSLRRQKTILCFS